jgi:RNA polymerase sigma factor (sigma-70 family)
VVRAELTDEPDAKLVEQVRAGSLDAFATLYRRHAGAVRTALTDNVHDRERRQDLVQETFTRALAKLASLREPAQFRPWVLQIARNAAIDDLRARSQVHFEPIDDEHAPPSVDHGPELAAEVVALAAGVRAGWATLSPRDAAAVSMAVHLGFGPNEIAAALGITYGNAKVVLHRARARLRAALVQQELVSGGTTE